VEREIESAMAAREDGFEGRARVIARRAAAFAISSWMYVNAVNKQSAISTLVEFHSLDIPEDVKTASSHLLLKVNEQYSLDEGIDLLMDARVILDFCKSTNFC